jgi:molybdenum cofactor cytidylyltransferase
MERAPSLCGIILAAGASTRMGRDKALLPWPPGSASSETFLSAAIRSFSPHTEMVIVVAGKNSEAVAPLVYAEGAFLVENPDPDRGQFSSLQIGLQEVLSRGRDAALITLVDRPPVKQATILSLISAFHQALRQQKWAVVPEFEGKHGHPYVASREMLEAFLKAPSNSTARDIEHANQKFIEYFAIADALVTANIDTPEDYSALTRT